MLVVASGNAPTRVMCLCSRATRTSLGWGWCRVWDWATSEASTARVTALRTVLCGRNPSVRLSVSSVCPSSACLSVLWSSKLWLSDPCLVCGSQYVLHLYLYTVQNALVVVLYLFCFPVLSVCADYLQVVNMWYAEDSERCSLKNQEVTHHWKNPAGCR